MRKIKVKLNSNSGVSLLFSMVVFLVVCMVSVTILTAAVTSMKRAHQNRKDVQSSLTLESAVRLVCDELDGSKYVVTTIYKKQNENVYMEPSTYEEPSHSMREVIAAAVNASRNHTASSGMFTISTNNIKISDVNVGYELKQRDTEENNGSQKIYEMIFTFQVEETREMAYLTFDVRCNREESESTHIDPETNAVDYIVTTVTETYLWESPKMKAMAGGSFE